jgi:hypothetical protein
MLPAYIPNFAEVARTTKKVGQAWFRWVCNLHPELSLELKGTLAQKQYCHITACNIQNLKKNNNKKGKETKSVHLP